MNQTLIPYDTIQNYGSFRDSRRMPIHRWFTYPAGYSYKLIESKIHEYGLTEKSLIVDPFLGSGTTTLTAKHCGIRSIGVEAHPFVAWVAKVKCSNHAHIGLEKMLAKIDKKITNAHPLKTTGVYPDLIYRCFDEQNLQKLTTIRKIVLNLKENSDFFRLALVASLRNISTAGTGWPYIAPSKYAIKKTKTDAQIEFIKQCNIMIDDVKNTPNVKTSRKIISGDSKNLSKYVQPKSANLVITSPPYLNNYDYADRTRMETYFMGICHNWGDVTDKIRSKLITAATTQVRVRNTDEENLMPTVKLISMDIYDELFATINKLTAKRQIKPGKKQYDMMVAGYFEDMARIIIEIKKITANYGHFVLVLGDSAPYGVHIPTDELIGRLAVCAGFKKYDVEMLRKRGDKWKNNPQRHHVKLRESLVTVSN